MPTAEALRRVLEAAEAVDRAIDARASLAELGSLRRRLDECFAGVLDALGEAESGGYRRALVEQFSRLSESLDGFERAAADRR
jgi:hypothetical protein